MPHGLGFVPHGTSDVTVLHVPLGSSPPPPAPPLLDEAPPVPVTPPVVVAMPPVLDGALAPLLGVPPAPAAGPPPIATGSVISGRSGPSGAHAESAAPTTNAVAPGKRAPRATDARFIDALLQRRRTAFTKNVRS